MRKANVGEAAIPRRPTVCGQLSLSAPHTHRRLEVVCWLALERLEPGEDATLILQPCLGIFSPCSVALLRPYLHAIMLFYAVQTKGGDRTSARPVIAQAVPRLGTRMRDCVQFWR